MSDESGTVLLHQLLHGYQDGHTMISSSLNLDSENRRLVGVLTDMSGPTLQRGFDEYISGYGLASEGYYAISKTWYATEMPRSGSVWTHTLLIPFSDLPKIENANDILRAFRRPIIHDKGYKSEYKLPIQLSVHPHDGIYTRLSQQIVCESVVRGLYDSASQAVIIKSKDSQTFETLVLEIWLQQWPRLRRSFNFCTGAIYPRNISGKYFDLQVCPEKFERNVAVPSNILVLEPENGSFSNSKPAWVTVACADLQSPSELRPFLRRYGADVEGMREGFSKLVNSYLYITRIDDQSNVVNLISALSAIYPNENDGETLKLDMLQSRILDAGSHFYSKESEALLALATTECFKSFNYEKLKFLDRFLAIYYNELSEAIKILNQLLKHDINPWGEKLLERIASNLTESEFEALADVFDKKLAFALASQNSQLLYSDSFWRTYKNDHGELLSILLRYGETHNIEWIRIIDILVGMNSNVAGRMHGSFSLDLVTRVLHWSNSRNSSRINQSWIDLLRSKPSTIISWLASAKSVSESTLKIAIYVLNPNSPEVIAGGSHMWVNFLAGLGHVKDEELHIRTAAFALALAFNKPDKFYLELVSTSFETVYFALKDDRLSYDFWQPIEVHTKSLSWYNDWDKCKKLLDALFINFREVRWTRSQIEVLFYSEEVRERALHRYKKKFD